MTQTGAGSETVRGPARALGRDAAGVRLITLDLDETVWPCWSAIARAEERLFGWLSERAPALAKSYSIERLREHRAALRQARPELAHDITALRTESLGEILIRHGYERDWARQGVALFMEERNRVEPYPDVAPVLGRLAARYCLVSITNGNAEVGRTPLRGRFNRSISAADVGASKPAPAMFEAAMGHAGVAPDAAVHVGDDPFLDVDAARRLGMRTVWVNRSGAPWPEALAPADLEVSDFFALERWLSSIGPG